MSQLIGVAKVGDKEFHLNQFRIWNDKKGKYDILNEDVRAEFEAEKEKQKKENNK